MFQETMKKITMKENHLKFPQILAFLQKVTKNRLIKNNQKYHQTSVYLKTSEKNESVVGQIVQSISNENDQTAWTSKIKTLKELNADLLEGNYEAM